MMSLYENFNISTIIKSIKMMDKKNKLFVFYIFTFCAIEVIGIPLYTYGIKGVINAVTDKNYSMFWHSIILVVINHMIWSFYSPISSYFCSYASKSTIRDLKINTTKHIIRLPQKYHDSISNGELLSILSSDIACLEGIYDWSFYKVINSALIGIGGLMMMAILDWRYAIVVFALGSLSVYTTAYFSKKIEKNGDQLQKKLAQNSINIYEFVKAAKTIRLLKLVDYKKSQFLESTQNEANIRIDNGRVTSKMNAIITAISVTSYLAILAIGSVFVYYKLSDWGTIIAIAGLKYTADCLFSECGQFMAGMQVNIAGVKRLFKIIDKREDNIITDGKFNIIDSSLPLQINNLSFSYDGNTPVIENFNLSLEYGKLTALIGESGCGKSTLIKLLLALYEPDNGTITYSGNEEVTIQNLRNKTAYVPQDPMLFSDTVYANIACGNESVTLKEVVAAAKAAHADEFIQAMLNGYDTILLEDGKSLSGGQKQRIAIARALVKNAPILLLDEITSALDSDTEQKIFDTICEISKNKAVLMITHNMNIAEYTNVLYYMKNPQS